MSYRTRTEATNSYQMNQMIANKIIKNKIMKIINKMPTLSNKQDKIKEFHKLFNEILLTEDGMNFMNKYKTFKKNVQEKLEYFYDESYDIPEFNVDVIEWHMMIFKSPIRQIREKELKKWEEYENSHMKKLKRIQELLEPEEEDTFENWINKMSVSATLTRNRKCFLRKVWDILHDINNSDTVSEASQHNKELYVLLNSKYGQQMLRLLPEFTSKIEKEICKQHVNEKITLDSFLKWADNWYDIFGKLCDYNFNLL